MKCSRFLADKKRRNKAPAWITPGVEAVVPTKDCKDIRSCHPGQDRSYHDEGWSIPCGKCAFRASLVGTYCRILFNNSTSAANQPSWPNKPFPTAQPTTATTGFNDTFFAHAHTIGPTE